jgi:hypothetical protein
VPTIPTKTNGAPVQVPVAEGVFTQLYGAPGTAGVSILSL